MAMRARTALKILTIAAAVAVTYVKIWRPWELTWGATPDEVSRPLPGDDLVTRPTFNATERYPSMRHRSRSGRGWSR